MVLHQDYLMRTIQALTQAFLNLIGATDKSPATLRMEVDGTLADHFATQPELLAGLDIDRLDEEPPEVCAQLARMFALQAELSRKLGDPMREAISVRWAIHSFARGFTVKVDADIEEAAFEFLRSPSVEDHAKVTEVRRCYVALFRSAAREDRLEHAEDAIFAAVELGVSAAVVDEARAYFESILQLEEPPLTMTFGEVETIIEDLSTMRQSPEHQA